jgi:hypothetical protein
MTDIQTRPDFVLPPSATDTDRMFHDNIVAALQEAMAIRGAGKLSHQHFKNLVLFILNVKCGLI